jgi:hypothetical protein
MPPVTDCAFGFWIVAVGAAAASGATAAAINRQRTIIAIVQVAQ